MGTRKFFEVVPAMATLIKADERSRIVLHHSDFAPANMPDYMNPAGAGGPQIISSCAFHTFGRCGRSRCQGRGSK